MGQESGAKEALNQFRDAIATGPFYPDIERVMEFLSPVLSLFAFLLGIVAVVMICAFVLRYSIDVIYVLMKSSGSEEGDNFITTRASKKARKADDLWQYVKEAGWQSIIALAIAGILITGQALPLASMVMNVIGSGIDAVVTFTPEDTGRTNTGGDIYE